MAEKQKRGEGTGKSARAWASEQLKNGRDEMNLVEFPFATLSDRSDGVHVLEFQVSDTDRVSGLPVERKLTVTGDPKYGLPTAKDEEVYLGLLQLTKFHTDFSTPTVQFTRHELIRLLDWSNNDWAYERVATALARLTGVRLFYQNAWRDNANKVFKDRGGFGILDSFVLRDGRKSSGPTEDLHSEFRWNAVLFESFQAGYLKRLDFETVRSLGTKAKRLYRYLDKHFNPPKYARLAYDLRTLACERLGFSRDYDAVQIRRALQPAVEELEAYGFLVAEGVETRYRKIARGKWEVSFERAGGKTPPKPPPSKPAAREGDPGKVVVVQKAVGGDINAAQALRVRNYLAALPHQERARLEQEAVASADPFLRTLLDSGGRLGETSSQVILYKHIARLLAAVKKSKSE
jgi:hypothetical protein